MTIVVGTAGHIDHGKTALLRALTGIDADRLPEERRRGMTIDVGYAHLALPDGSELDFVDVPGHDRLVGNMLVGAGEVDAVLLVVAADDGPRAQTLEHLGLIDALGLVHGLAVVSKIDLVATERVRDVAAAVRAVLSRTSLAAAPVVAASSMTGFGIVELRAELLALRDRASRRPAQVLTNVPRLAIDRAFSVRGRGVVVTGTLRGGVVSRGDVLRLDPGERPARVRGIQIHGRDVELAGPGRVALNLIGMELNEVRRGMVASAEWPNAEHPSAGRPDVVAVGPTVTATHRLLVALHRPVSAAGWPPRDRTRVRLHVGTDQVDAAIGRAGRDALDLADGRCAAILRVAAPVAVAIGDRFVLRRPSPGTLIAGGVVLDTWPGRGVSRRRQTVERVARLAAAVDAGSVAGVWDARTELHGAVAPLRGAATDLSPDIVALLQAAALASVNAHHAAAPPPPGPPPPPPPPCGPGTCAGPRPSTRKRRLPPRPRTLTASSPRAFWSVPATGCASRITRYLCATRSSRMPWTAWLPRSPSRRPLP